MTSSEARAHVETLREEKRRETYIRDSKNLLLYTGQGGLRMREPYKRTKVKIYYDSRKEEE